MLEAHIRAQYNLYGHKGYYSRIGTMDYETHKYEERYCKGLGEIYEFIRAFDTKRNIYISRAPFDSNRNVLMPFVTTFDLDPVREKDSAATEKQNKLALEAGRKILYQYPGGYLANSGNGALVIYRWSYPISNIAPIDVYYKKEKVLIDELQTLVGDQIRIDFTNYVKSITKLSGTLSTKGECSLRRYARFVDYPIPPYRNSKKLLERLNEISVPKSISLSGIDVSKIKSSYNGDRSLGDWHLVNYLKKSGVGPSDALRLLEINPLGRREDEKDQERLINKIYGSNEQILPVTSSNYFEELFNNGKEDHNDSIRTGFTELDKCLGALRQGELSTFSARSGYGKTTFGCTVAEYLRSKGKKVLYFSTEMASKYLMHKIIAIACNVSLENMVHKHELPRSKIETFQKEFESNPMIICDEFSPKIELVQQKVNEYNPHVIIFDHITQSGTHWEKVAEFTRQIKALTKEQNCVTLLLSMLNEPGRGKDGQVMQSIRGDIRGSQEIIYLSDIFCVFNNPYEIKGQYQPVEILIAKNRYGLSGEKVTLYIDKITSKFIEKGLI